ncbi:hypothetical protein INR49_023714 [Caranx melampygus]|nr:hypothetical protein INR49_023714 [Caranx melampygus]
MLTSGEKRYSSPSVAPGRVRARIRKMVRTRCTYLPHGLDALDETDVDYRPGTGQTDDHPPLQGAAGLNVWVAVAVAVAEARWRPILIARDSEIQSWVRKDQSHAFPLDEFEEGENWDR